LKKSPSISNAKSFIKDKAMTYDQKLNRLFVVISYALVHKVALEDALKVFERALGRFGRAKS
jgi:exonuclease VII small subunit